MKITIAILFKFALFYNYFTFFHRLQVFVGYCLYLECMEVKLPANVKWINRPEIKANYKASAIGVTLFEEETITIAFCDFDNSFAPSYHVQQLGYRVSCDASQIAPDLKHELENFVPVSLNTLQLLKEHVDHLVILTNADVEHVDLFTSKFLPAMYDFVKSCEIISAKQTGILPGDDIHCPLTQIRWKYEAARRYLHQFDIVVQEEDDKVSGIKNSTRPAANIICIGDSTVEHDSLKQLVAQIPRCVLKCIKLGDQPTIGYLQGQLRLLYSLVPYIVHALETLEFDFLMLSPVPSCSFSSVPPLSAPSPPSRSQSFSGVNRVTVSVVNRRCSI